MKVASYPFGRRIRWEPVYLYNLPHAGLVRLPDVPADQRITLLDMLIDRRGEVLENRVIVAIRDERIRTSFPPAS